MENYAIYSHVSDYDLILQQVRSTFPQITPEFKDNEDHKAIILRRKTGLWGKEETLTIRYRQRIAPSYHLRGGSCPVTTQLRGMYNFVASLQVNNEQIKALLLRKIETINAEIIFQVAPSLSSDTSRFLHHIAGSLNAFAFVQPGQKLSRSAVQHFSDATFKLLVDTAGNTGNGVLKVEIDSKYYDPSGPSTPEQTNRKNRSQQLLQDHAIKINQSLPVTPDIADVTLRKQKDVIERIYCLTLLAAKGEGVSAERLEEERARLSVQGFTEQELYFYNKPDLSDQERANLTWRYESLNVLLWSVKFIDELPFPSDICDVPFIVATVIKQTRGQFESGAALRDTTEILDQLDLIYRLHWACVDARLAKRQPDGGLNPGVVYERHYVLNWLTGYMDQEWDEVTTDT